MSWRVFLGILYTGEFLLLFLLTEYMTDVQACSLKELLGIFIVSVIRQTHKRTHLDTRALCRLMLGVSCQGLFIFFGARWGEEQNRCAEETVMLEPCWRCAGSLGWSVRAAAGSNGCHSNWEWWTACWQDGRGCMLIGAEAAGERSGCGRTRRLCKSEKNREGEVERKRYRWKKMYICGSAIEISGDLKWFEDASECE